MTERIQPRVDIASKKIFGVEENKDLLISLINSIVSKENQVEDVILLNSHNFKTEKLSSIDIKAKGVDGKQFNVEIHINDEADYDKRALYYWGKLYTEQLKTSDDYSKLNKTIGIYILNFTSITGTEKYHHAFHLVDEKTGLRYFKDIELHTIELYKFTKNSDDDLNSLVAKIKDTLDIWVAFLTRNDLLDPANLPKALDTPGIKKALTVLKVMNFSPIEREAYEENLKWFRIEANTLKKAEAKSREEGRVEGEEKKVIEMARKMLAKDKPIEEIIEFTELSKDQIEKLKSL